MMKKVTLICLVVLFVLSVTGCGVKDNTHVICITVPAGSKDAYVYSEEEILPIKGSITISCEEELGEVTLDFKPENEDEMMIFDSTPRVSSDMPLEAYIERGWYRIGVSVQNPTGWDRKVYLTVTNVDVRVE